MDVFIIIGRRNKLVISMFWFLDIFGSGKLIILFLGMKYIDSLLKCYLSYKIVVLSLIEFRY